MLSCLVVGVGVVVVVVVVIERGRDAIPELVGEGGGGGVLSTDSWLLSLVGGISSGL